MIWNTNVLKKEIIAETRPSFKAVKNDELNILNPLIIYESANKSIYIIDDYIYIKTLQLLKVCKSSIEIIIFSDNKGQNNLNKNFVKDFISYTGFNIKFKKNNKFHDRYIILDYDTENETLYHCGASSKDAGKRITTITQIKEK